MTVPERVANRSAASAFVSLCAGLRSQLGAQLQLFLVRTDGMHVGVVECRLIRSYLWFEVRVGRS